MEVCHTGSFLPSPGVVQREGVYVRLCVILWSNTHSLLYFCVAGMFSSDLTCARSMFSAGCLVSVHAVANLPAGLCRSVMYVGSLVAPHCAPVVGDKLNL